MNQSTKTTEREDGVLTSGSNLSYWTDSIEPIRFQKLEEDLTTDVVIVGGGISGLSVAYNLVSQGKKVVIIEDGFIGSGETGRTTAHISNALDDRYYEIEKRLGGENARLAAESHTSAIDFIEKVVKDENIDCDFRRVDGYLFPHPSDNADSLHSELKATHRAGIQTELTSEAPGIRNEKGPFLKFPMQAQFHPMKYLKGLADAIVRKGGRIFTESHAESINKKAVKCGSFTVKVDDVVVTTNTPVNDLVTMHTKQHPYRTYVIGALVPKGSLPYSLWWDSGDLNSTWVSDPYHYVRLEEYNDWFDLLISGGEDHKTGQSEKENITEDQRYDRLIMWTRDHFPMIQDVVYRWSGQVMEPVDLMGFIGKNPGDKNIFIATGDSGNGITHGTIAGQLICDLILGKPNPWAELYDPSRITVTAAKEFLQEAGNMAAQYLDYFTTGDTKSIESVAPGNGAVMSFGGKKVAVYRDDENVVHTYSAICPHLGCVVHWNKDEKSFDCPCHGSRFSCQGNVLNGPSQSDLKKIELKKPN